MFIIMSFSYGLAVFIVVQSVMYAWNGLTLDPSILRRMKNLLATFVAAVFYFTIVYHLTNLYFAKQWDFERFILLDGGIFTALFWLGQIGVGTLLPLALLLHPTRGTKVGSVSVAAIAIIVGAFCQIYVIIIGGQAFPLDIFPGMQISSSFFDGVIHGYSPTLAEFLLGLGGLGIAFLITTIAVRVLHFMPQDDFRHVMPEVMTD